MDDYSDDESITQFYRDKSHEKTKELHEHYPGLGKFTIKSYKDYDALYGPIFCARYVISDIVKMSKIDYRSMAQTRALYKMVCSIISEGVASYRSLFPKEVYIVLSDLPDGVIIANPETLRTILKNEEMCRVMGKNYE